MAAIMSNSTSEQLAFTTIKHSNAAYKWNSHSSVCIYQNLVKIITRYCQSYQNCWKKFNISSNRSLNAFLSHSNFAAFISIARWRCLKMILKRQRSNFLSISAVLRLQIFGIKRNNWFLNLVHSNCKLKYPKELFQPSQRVRSRILHFCGAMKQTPLSGRATLR